MVRFLDWFVLGISHTSKWLVKSSKWWINPVPRTSNHFNKMHRSWVRRSQPPMESSAQIKFLFSLGPPGSNYCKPESARIQDAKPLDPRICRENGEEVFLYFPMPNFMNPSVPIASEGSTFESSCVFTSSGPAMVHLRVEQVTWMTWNRMNSYSCRYNAH